MMDTPRLTFNKSKAIDSREVLLKDITTFIKNGYTYKSDGDRKKRYKVTRIESISSGEININKLGSTDTIDESFLLKDGDILYSHINSLPYIGNCALYNNELGPIYHGMNLLNIRPNHQVIPSYLLYVLKSSIGKKYAFENAQRAVSQCSISASIVSSMKIPLPSLSEQKKIADFLSSYDEKISIQRERVEALERRKKGLLQKVFSQEIRFKADDGIEFPAWTLKALGDIFSFKNGLNASRDSFENGNIPCIGVYDICRCAPITENAIRGYVSVDSNIKESFRVNFGDVLFQRSSETLQDVGHACVYIGKESVVYNGFVIKGTPKKQRQYIPEFIHWMLQSDFVRRQAIAFGAGAQHYNIGQESISSIIGYFPCVAEQKKIAKLFTAVDDQMNIEKERLSTMETIKKGLIQGLFC